MDDVLILTKSRWKCRRAVKQLNLAFNELKLEKHPDKTFIGKIEKGFDFLGYHFSPKGLRIANITWSKFVARLHRLYEQKKTDADCQTILGEYVRRWIRWTSAGLNAQRQVILNQWPIKTPPVGGVNNTYHNLKLSAFFPSCNTD